MTSLNRWDEFDAGTLVSPTVVQVEDAAGRTHTAWVYVDVTIWDGEVQKQIKGPFGAGPVWDEAEEAAVLEAALLSASATDEDDFYGDDEDPVE